VKLDAKDRRVRAALAATQANWHASRRAWPEAVKAFDRLVAADPTNPAGWLRTPGLLRLATALLYQNRPRDAAALLKGGARRRALDGLPAAVDRVTVGMLHSAADGTIQVTEVLAGSPAARSRLRPGDVIVKVNDTKLTRESLNRFVQLLAGKAGTKVRLTVRHPGSEKAEVIELTRERFVNDPVTGVLLHPLQVTINERLAKEPRNPGLLELRAELAGQWSDRKAQVADYTAAIAALSRQKAKATPTDLKRLYARRGNAYVALKQWQKAVGDYARVVTDATTDDALLSNQALAQAELFLSSKRWTVLKPVEAKSALGATFSILRDNSILVGGANRFKDRYRVALTLTKPIDLAAVRLEALTHPSLPNNGPGRSPEGTFSQNSWKVTASSPDRKDPIALQFNRSWADHQLVDHPIRPNGHWNIYGGHGRNCTAIWSMSKPVSLAAGTKLTFEMQCQQFHDNYENLGHFRLSVSSDPAAIERERKHLAVRNLTDPWQKLAAAYRLKGDPRAIDQLVKRRPKAAGVVGDLFTREPNKNWQRAVEIYSKGITAKTTDARLLSKRARAYEALKKWKAAAADWSRAAAGNPEGAKLLTGFALRLAAGNQFALAQAQFENSQALYEQALKADPGNEVVTAELAQLLFDKLACRPGDLRGRFVRLDLPGENSQFPRHPADKDKKTINLAELQVFRGGQNIALRKKARQSTNGYPNARGAENAVDGNTRGEDNGPPYAHTGFENHPWWEVDLGSEQPIDRIVIWNRSEADYYARMNHFRIRVLDRSRRVVFERVVNKAPSPRAQIVPQVPQVEVADVEARLAAGYAVNGRNEEALVRFGTALRQAKSYGARKPIVELAARFDEVLAALARQRPGDAQLQLALARKMAQRAKQRLANKQPAKAQADLAKSREILTRLRAESQWSVLKPTELKSQGGEMLTVEKDGSIFVSGPNPDRAMYTLKLRTDLPTLTAIRLETIPDARLPNGGAGRYGNGNFHLAELTATLISGAADAKATPIELGSAIVDYDNYGNNPSRIFDGNPRTYWDTYTQEQKPHWVVVSFKSPVRTNGGSLSITLDSGISEWGQHGLGRFRLSATNAADLNRAIVRNDLKASEILDFCIVLAKAHAQQGHTKEAVASFTEALDLAADRAAKTKIITEAAPLNSVLRKLAQRAAPNAQFQAELARYFARRGNAPLAEAARTKARALFEKELAKEPKNAALAAELAEVLLIDSRAKWTLLKPTRMKSPGGATLTLQKDGSILSSGKHPQRDDYTVIAPTNVKNIGAIALDVLPHDSFAGAVGRGIDGQFVITQLEVSRVDRAGRRQPVPLTDAAADFEQADWPGFVARNVINGKNDSTTGWGVKPQLKTPHRLVVKPALPIAAGTPALTFVIRQQHFNQYHPLGLLVGRFRLSVSDDPQAFEHERNRLAAMKLTDPFTKLATAYHVIGDQAARDKLLALHPAATAGIGDVYALAQDWKRALAEYTRAIANGSKDARTFAARAEVYEKLEKWERAAADWASADASDKTLHYGTPPFLVLERRLHIHQRLQLWEKVLLDCNKLLKPERLGDSPWIFNARGEAYGGLRQWQKARADHDRAIQVCSPEERGSFHFFRGRHFAGQSQWKRAALDMQQAYEKPADYSKGTWPRSDWWSVRDAALIFAVAGDVENYGKAAAECYRKQTGQVPNAEDSKWMVLTMLLFPEMITKENRTRLLELAGKTDDYWRPRLTAAIYFRGTHDQKAAQLWGANGGGPQFLFLAAMAQQKLGNHDRAKQLFEEGSTWIQQQRDNDPACGSGVPRPFSWQDWSVCVRLQREAARKVVGPQLTKLDARLKKEPDNARALLERARLLAEIGLIDEALADLSKMPKAKTNFSDYYGLRGCMLTGLNRTDEALSDLNRAALSQSTDALVYAARGKILWRRGATKPARKDLEKSLDMKPSAQTARLLAGLLLEASPSEWTVLKPTQMESEGGATLTLQPDGSILAGGTNPDRGAYTITAPAGLDRIRAIRLEALPDTSLPNNGPGRHPSGNFHLNEFRVFSGTKPTTLAGVFATYTEDDQLRYIVDGKIDENHWGIYPNSGQRHTAFFAANFAHARGDPLKFEMYFSRGAHKNCDLGRFRLSVSADPAILERERERIAARKITDPWAQLAAAYHLSNDQPAIIRLVKHHPAAAAGIGDLYAAAQDWERAIAEYRKAITDQPADVALLTKLAAAYQAAGRTREAIPLLVKASAADPKDTLLSLKLAALEAWFGQEKELAGTRQRILAFAKGKSEVTTVERAAKACSILPTPDMEARQAALVLGRKGVKLGNRGEWNLLALGMTEYRSGNYAAAEEALRSAAKAGPNNPHITGTAAFYRAMSLFRQGRKDEARKLAISAAARMKPLPADEQNPLTDVSASAGGGDTQEFLILWLAYKEAKAMIKFEAAPPPKGTDGKK
jgi:tetratricopeptide (TPR) repeat protein